MEDVLVAVTDFDGIAAGTGISSCRCLTVTGLDVDASRRLKGWLIGSSKTIGFFLSYNNLRQALATSGHTLKLESVENKRL